MNDGGALMDDGEADLGEEPTPAWLAQAIANLAEPEPPAGFLEEAVAAPLRRRKRVSGVSGLVAGVAIVLVVFGGIGIGALRSSPRVLELLGLHDEMMHMSPDELSAMPTADEGGHVVAPPVLGDIERKAMTKPGGDVEMQSLYVNDELAVSVFEQAGEPDMDALDGGEMVPDGDGFMWTKLDGDMGVLVMEHGSMTLTLVAQSMTGPLDPSVFDELAAAAHDMPLPEDESTVDDLRRTSRALLEWFAL